jgi:hypothetical protein
VHFLKVLFPSLLRGELPGLAFFLEALHAVEVDVLVDEVPALLIHEVNFHFGVVDGIGAGFGRQVLLVRYEDLHVEFLAVGTLQAVQLQSLLQDAVPAAEIVTALS